MTTQRDDNETMSNMFRRWFPFHLPQTDVVELASLSLALAQDN